MLHKFTHSSNVTGVFLIMKHFMAQFEVNYIDTRVDNLWYGKLNYHISQTTPKEHIKLDDLKNTHIKHVTYSASWWHCTSLYSSLVAESTIQKFMIYVFRWKRNDKIPLNVTLRDRYYKSEKHFPWSRGNQFGIIYWPL